LQKKNKYAYPTIPIHLLFYSARLPILTGPQNFTVDVDVVDLRAQADASMPASNNNVNYTIYSNF